MIRHKKVKIPIYHGQIDIFIFSDFKELNKKYNLNIDEKYLNGAGLVDNYPGFDLRYVVFLNPDIPTDSLCHEAVHLSNRIFYDRGHILDLINDEPQAYLTGWIFEQLYKAIKK